MLAAVLPDLDGLGAILGQERYWDYHHILGHNLFAGLLFSGILTILSTHKAKAFLLYIGLFHLHVLMDFFGSGPGWTIEYLWPISRWQMEFSYAWEFYSWQNLGTFFALLVWTYLIIRTHKRTPLEYPLPKLDRQLVDLILRRKKTSAGK